MKPLKILLGNNTLSLLAGSETWTYTLALQLKEMGHSVHCFSTELGIISEKLEEAGIPCFDNLSTLTIKPFSFVLEEKLDHEYDVIISNHNHIVDYLRSQFPRTPIISTIHGIIHFMDGNAIAPEHPALNAGVAQFVAVSEEVQQKLKDDYGLDSIVIRQPLDIRKYSNLRPPSENKPKLFLINSNYASKDSQEVVAVREAAKLMGAKVIAVGINFAPQFDLTRAIEDSDVVFAMGRSLLEGVAAGRLGICQGRWGTGGSICKENIDEIRAQNFSGRNSGGKYATPEEIVEMIEKRYTPENLEWGKEYVKKDHNILLAAEEYIRIARELIGEAYSKPSKGNGVDPLSKPFRLASNA